MSTVAVVTDSTASVPKAIIQQFNIHLVAYYIHRCQDVLRDLVTIQREEFLHWMATASPEPGNYLEKYTELIRRGFRQIISIHMISKGSGAYQIGTEFVSPDAQVRVEKTCSQKL